VDTILKGEREEMLLGDLKFNFLHTPGHTPGSISVYIDTKDGRVLFGQDIHGPFSPAWGSDLLAWGTSMHKLIDLKADVLCEGHAGVYRGKEIEEYIESCLERFSSA